MNNTEPMQLHWSGQAKADARKGPLASLAAVLIGVAALLQCSCSSGDAIHVTIDSAAHATLGNTSTVRIQLYGHDLNVADAPATVLHEYRYNITALPASYVLDFQSSWLDKIQPRSGEGRYGYYLDVSIYQDNKDDVADYRLDYDRTDERLYAYVISNVSDLSGTYYIKPYVAVP